MSSAKAITMTEKDEKRFWSKVALPNEDGCMLWLGMLGSRGYGLFPLAGSSVGAHRFSLWWSIGRPPINGLLAAHSCRHRHCVSPTHLRWATYHENSADQVRDGTRVEGELIGNHRLSSAEVKQIRDLSNFAGWSQRELSRVYGVSQTNVGKILRWETWTCLQEEAS